MDILPHSERPLFQGQYISYGEERETEILRYQDPDKSLSGVIFKTTVLQSFRPKSLEHTSLFVPGSSGCPIIYKNHIIGLISVSNVHLEHNREIQIGAVVFGPSVKESLEQQLGLQLDKVE